jgi:hypothetical protein
MILVSFFNAGFKIGFGRGEPELFVNFKGIVLQDVVFMINWIEMKLALGPNYFYFSF